MKSSAHIVNELKDISPLLASIEKKNIFSVPEGYFNNLDKQILYRVNSEPSFVFTGSQDKTLKVPEGYFENLAGNILQKIKKAQLKSDANELREISPLLYDIRNKNVFKVPETYFRNLADDILSKLKSSQQAKVVAIKKRSYFWNYAAAAIVTGIIALSSLWIFNKPSEKPAIGTIAETAFIPSSSIQESFKYKTREQIEEGISELSKDDIIKYLQITDNDFDNEDLTGSIGEKELPAQEDYLLDEKTLEKYLNQLDSAPSEN